MERDKPSSYTGERNLQRRNDSLQITQTWVVGQQPSGLPLICTVVGQSLRGCPALPVLYTSCSGKEPNCSSVQLISQERHRQLLCRATSQQLETSLNLRSLLPPLLQMKKRNNSGAITIYSEVIKRSVLQLAKGVEQIGRARPEQVFGIMGSMTSWLDVLSQPFDSHFIDREPRVSEVMRLV